MSARYSRRDFLTGALASGALSAAALYMTPGGRPAASVTLALMTGDDSTQARPFLVDLWNRTNPSTGANLKVLSGDSTDQRNAMVTAAESGDADILNLDVIDIPYFAHRELITPIELPDSPVFLRTTLKPSQVDGDPTRYWAIPFNTDVGMFFDRLAGSPPSVDIQLPSVSDVLDAKDLNGRHQFVGQLQPTSSGSDEAFVVNVLEQALSRDQGILDADTGIPAFDLPRWIAAMQPLRQALDAGRVTASDTEDNSRAAFTTMRLGYMRNWPVQYRKLLQPPVPDTDAQRARVRLGRLSTQRPGAAILGGQSLALVAKSRHRSRATDLIRFLTGDAAQRIIAAHGLAAARAAAYDDADMIATTPHLAVLRGAVEDAHPRPIHWNYRAFSAVLARYMRGLLQEKTDLPSRFTDEMRQALA